jgi:fibronectin type 3 domain-containing protein
MRFGLHAFLAFALLLPIAVTPLAAQTRQTMDHDDESGVEDEEAKFPPMRVNPEVFNAADEVFVSIARKIEDGTATMPERRTYWALYRQYYPFTPESRPPANWRLKAWQQAATLDPAAVAPRMLSMASKSNSTAAARITPSAVVDYLWSGVGQAAPWYQGQPPSNDARTATPDWGSGRATAVWVNPFNKSDVLVGTACGGVWKTTKMSATKDDVNATWTPLTDFAPSLSVGSLTAQVSPLDGNRLGPNTKIWVGTGEGNFGGGQVEGIGVLKSVDGGATWQVRQIPWTLETTGFPMLDRTSIRRIVVDPRNTNNLWAAADGGLFRSNDAGDSWRLVATAPYYRKYGDCFGVYWQDVVIDDTAPAAGAPSYVYAAFSRTGNSGCSALSREDSGVYRSKDDGATWESISIAPANCPSTLAAPAVARVAGTLPAGTYNYRFTAITGGVESGASFASADLAVVANSQINVSWTAVPGATAYNVYGRDTGAGTGNAFYFIGTTNTTSFSDTGAVTPDVTRPAPMARGYQCVGSGFAAGGLTNTTTVAGNIGRITLTQAPQNKKHLYVQIQSVAANTPSLGIWETTDATAATVAWTARNSATNYTGGQGWYAMVGAVNPSAEAQVIVGGLDMYISANNATTLNQTSSWTGWGSTTYAHADQHHVTWVKGSVPKDDGTTDALDWIFLVNDGGFLIGTVNSTAANGVTWATNNRGMMTGQSYGIGQSGTQANAVHLGNQDNGEPKATLTAGNVTTWWESRGGDGGFADTLRTNDARALQEYVYGGIYYTTNMAYTNTVPTWSCIGGFGGCTALCNGSCVPDNAMEFIAPLTLDRSTTTIRAYTGTRFVYRNTNTFTGGTWVVYSPDLTTTNNANDIVHIHSANNNGVAGTLFASTINGKIWKSVNATCDTANCATWTNLTTATLPARSCNWVETDPNNAMRVYAAFGGFNTGHIFRSIDGGTTWTDVSGLLPNEPFDTIAVDPSSVNRVFVASDSGVFVNEDAWNTNTWMRVNNGVLPLGKLYTLAYSPANNKLRAVTHGRGLWELTVSANSACGGNVPAAPTGVTTTSSSGQVTISWTAVAGAASYKVYRVAGSACPTNDIGNVIGSGITGTSYVDTTSCTVGNFAYRVVAVNAANCESPASSCVTATIAAPVAPATLTATAGVPGQINLTWSAVTGASRYEVFRYNNSTCPAPNNGVQIASNVSGTTYSDTGLTNGTPYAYFVRVQTSCPNAPFSSCATATPSACTPPAAPASVSATPSAPNQITVTWSTVAGASSYKVYRATGACTALDAAYTLLVSGVAGTSYNDTTATFGNRYSYKVISTATCDSALSASCAWAEAYGDCVLAPNFGGVDTVITTAGSTCGIDLTWAAGTTNCPGTGSISYTVYRSTTSGFAPGAATRIVSGVSGTTYTDSNQLQAGVTYYYVVRAVDSRNNVEDLNTAEDTATAQVSCTAAPNDVQVFTVTATGAAAATSGQNVLQWVNPASGAPGTTVRVNFRTDTYPTSPADPAATVLFTGRPVTFGAKDSFTHSGLTIGTTYYYAIWVQY